MRTFSRPLLYFCFAGACTALNLGAQKLVNALLEHLSIQGGLTVYMGMLAGTAIGLVTKFFLDKFIVFRHRARSAASNLGKFMLYGLFGVVTTAIFWGVELLFYYLWSADASKYVGGFIGLAAGYAVKYLLDKTYVFGSKSAKRDSE
jgi:putative flippase GtrA